MNAQNTNVGILAVIFLVWSLVYFNSKEGAAEYGIHKEEMERRAILVFVELILLVIVDSMVGSLLADLPEPQLGGATAALNVLTAFALVLVPSCFSEAN
ncbi:MAG: hypothetical protein ACTSU5_22130 [Promethearchaeota archaeon]